MVIKSIKKIFIKSIKKIFIKSIYKKYNNNIAIKSIADKNVLIMMRPLNFINKIILLGKFNIFIFT